MQVVLAMFKADGDRRSFSITRDLTVVGRREDCDLRIPLGDISRKHCRLVKDGDTLRLEDLGSSNGTYHNNQRVQEAVLEAGDQIRIGPVTFVVQIDGVPSDEELSPAPQGDASDTATDGLEEIPAEEFVEEEAPANLEEIPEGLEEAPAEFEEEPAALDEVGMEEAPVEEVSFEEAPVEEEPVEEAAVPLEADEANLEDLGFDQEPAEPGELTEEAPAALEEMPAELEEAPAESAEEPVALEEQATLDEEPLALDEAAASEIIGDAASEDHVIEDAAADHEAAEHKGAEHETAEGGVAELDVDDHGVRQYSEPPPGHDLRTEVIETPEPMELGDLDELSEAPVEDEAEDIAISTAAADEEGVNEIAKITDVSSSETLPGEEAELTSEDEPGLESPELEHPGEAAAEIHNDAEQPVEQELDFSFDEPEQPADDLLDINFDDAPKEKNKR